MKKSYQTPTTAVTYIETQPILTTSKPGVTVDRNTSVDAAAVETKGNNESYNVWNDDWSE